MRSHLKSIGPVTLALVLLLALNIQIVAQNQPAVKDLKYFLHRMHTIDHLPELEKSHTAMSSTWDTTGNNNDGVFFKNLHGKENTLLDMDGPGCIHRIFTGMTYGFGNTSTFNTKIKIYLDNSPNPVYDMDVIKFFDSHSGPFPYPLVFQKSYPGILFPIPFAKHIKVVLVNEARTNWGNYWQVVYTKYPPVVNVKSLSLPLTKDEQKELDALCKAWLKAESVPPQAPTKWTEDANVSVEPGRTVEIHRDGRGVIREMRIEVSPNSGAIIHNKRMKIRWDGSSANSIDVPLGYFFGTADYQNQIEFNSLLLGITANNAYSRFPMPFDTGFTITFENNSTEKIENLRVMLDIKSMKELPDNWGRFHATWNEIIFDSLHYNEYPKFGKSPKPYLVLLDVNKGGGKYIGNLLHVGWPYSQWWGEGDWLIWSDETAFPPSYHGTGSEEYFNSGWCWFDRKAISGYITQMPANCYVYSFHMNDNFYFDKNIKVAVEIWWQPNRRMRSIYGSTAFWYSSSVQDANSRKALITPRVKHDLKTNEFRWE